MNKTIIDKIEKEFSKRKLTNSSYSLRAFARDVDIDVSSLSKILNNRIAFTKKMLNRLCRSSLISEEDIKNYFNDLANRQKSYILNESIISASKSLNNKNSIQYSIPVDPILIPEVIKKIEEFKRSLVVYVSRRNRERINVSHLYILFQQETNK